MRHFLAWTRRISRRYQVNSRRLVSLLKLASLCALVSCLLAFDAPAHAVTMYSAEINVRVTACLNPGSCLGLAVVPTGTGLIASLGAGSSSAPAPIQIGNATARGGGDTRPRFDPSPNSFSAAAGVFGIANAPPESFAQSFGSAVFPGLLFNSNATTEAFPMDVTGVSQIFITLAPDRVSRAEVHTSFQLLLDGNPLVTGLDGTVTSFVPTSPLGLPVALPGRFLVTAPLAPGFHSLLLQVEASGFASELAPVPEPMTVILFATTGAGLGLARWYRRRAGERDRAA
jgi:hypothetical protein